VNSGTNTPGEIGGLKELQARLSRLPDRAIPAEVIEICGRLRSLGHGAWVVGGCLRDALIGREPGDWDIATSAKPSEVMRAFRRVVPTGIEHGTVTVLLNRGHYEVTTLRREGSYSDRRRPDNVVFIEELKEDLARRDFTVNAFAFDPLTAAVEDPFGGLEDLGRRILRSVGDPRRRFSEDGLRVLRAARLTATLQFELESETALAIADCLDALRAVSHERVRDEWLKAMNAQRPSQAFEIMREYGILKVICPDLLEEVGCVQNRCHAYDVWQHTMLCIDATPNDPVLRLAALLHDEGKTQSW
jgi:tRNA nucleotidyltransferase (CCA-adding enzyme)